VVLAIRYSQSREWVLLVRAWLSLLLALFRQYVLARTHGDRHGDDSLSKHGSVPDSVVNVKRTPVIPKLGDFMGSGVLAIFNSPQEAFYTNVWKSAHVVASIMPMQNVIAMSCAGKNVGDTVCAPCVFNFWPCVQILSFKN
jgi:hypothetical protein